MWKYTKLDNSQTFEIMFESLVDNDSDMDLKQCRLSIKIFGHRLEYITSLRIINTVEEHCDKYTIYHPKKYGFYIFEGNHFVVNYGVSVFNEGLRNTIRSKSWSCFLPWSEWKFIRHVVYNIDGSVYRSENGYARNPNYNYISDGCEYIYFEFKNQSGALDVAKCYIEEREWSKGVGLFSFLKWFTKNNIRRNLDCEFYYGIPEPGKVIGRGFGLIGLDYIGSVRDGLVEYNCSDVRQITETEYVQFCQIEKLSKM